MTEKEETYRPKSPILDGAVPPGHLSRLGSESQTPTAFGFPPGYSFSPRASYDASPYFSTQNSQASNYFASQPHSQTALPQLSRTPSVPAVYSQQSQHYSPSYSQPRQLPPTFSIPSYPSQIFSQGPICDSPLTPQHPEMPRTRAKRPADDEDDDYNPNSAPSRTPLAPTMSNILATQTMPSGEDLALTIDVKTKFPVARIKRIMQADEDVGKVAQATPTAVAKALELFMITLILKGSNTAKSQNSRRVTAQHLKSALMADKEFDFLADCCADVPDEDKGGASKKGGRVKSEADDSDEEMAPAPAKKRKGSKRKGSEESD